MAEKANDPQIPSEIRENVLKLARLIHECYNEEQKKFRPNDPLEYSDWDSLPDDLKESNIRQALGFQEKLAEVRCYLASSPANPNDELVEIFSDEEIEIMSEKEHMMWVDERISNGWTKGPVKDVSRKIHPDIVPWEKLSEYERELDRQPTRNMVKLAKVVGLNIYRDCRKSVKGR